MEPHVMHDIIHRSSGSSESCPVCSGKMDMKDKKGMLEKCNEILKQRSPSMYSEGKGVKISGDRDLKLMTSFEFGESSELPKEIMLVPVGEWNTTKYGEVKIEKSDILQMAENFNDKVRKGVMIDVDHGASQHGDAAAGWIRKVEARDDGLWAVDIEWSSLGQDLVKGKVYKFLSPEFDIVYVDPQNKNKMYENVLIATSLVNRPLLREIPELSPAYAFSETGEKKNLTNGSINVMIFTEPMNIDQILAKKKEERTSEEAAFLEANKQTFSEEQKTKYAAEATQAKETAVTPTGTPEKITAREGETIVASEELKKLKEDAEKGRLAFRELQKSNLKEEYNKLAFSEAGGKLTPAAVTKIVDLVIDLSEEQKKLFDEVINALPERKIFGEIGKEKDTTSSQEADAITAEVSSYAKENKMNFTEALKALKASDPSKFESYGKNLTRSN